MLEKLAKNSSYAYKMHVNKRNLSLNLYATISLPEWIFRSLIDFKAP